MQAPGYDPGPLTHDCLHKPGSRTAPDICQVRRDKMAHGSNAWPECVGCPGVLEPGENLLCACGQPKMRRTDGKLMGACRECHREQSRAATKARWS